MSSRQVILTVHCSSCFSSASESPRAGHSSFRKTSTSAIHFFSVLVSFCILQRHFMACHRISVTGNSLIHSGTLTKTHCNLILLLLVCLKVLRKMQIQTSKTNFIWDSCNLNISAQVQCVYKWATFCLSSLCLLDIICKHKCCMSMYGFRLLIPVLGN